MSFPFPFLFLSLLRLFSLHPQAGEYEHRAHKQTNPQRLVRLGRGFWRCRLSVFGRGRRSRLDRHRDFVGWSLAVFVHEDADIDPGAVAGYDWHFDLERQVDRLVWFQLVDLPRDRLVFNRAAPRDGAFNESQPVRDRIFDLDLPGAFRSVVLDSQNVCDEPP